jgi:predicted ATPase/DNA-binding winged helix-turn-helix (wHTH) protein
MLFNEVTQDGAVPGGSSEYTRTSFAFGPFTLVAERRMLLRGDAPVRIGGRAVDILLLLVEHAGELVSKRELLAHVWPNTVVDEGNLKVNIAALRRALGDGGPEDSRYIGTVTGRGYRFIAPVKIGEPRRDAVSVDGKSIRQHNLPSVTTRIVGRADVIETIRRDFELSRLVTIVGAGGIGKSTVALAVAEDAIGSFKDGVWFVDLALLKDPNLIPNAIATAASLTANSTDMLAALCSLLRDREMLLLLDNCEHIIDAAATCANQMLAEAAGVKILATSREPLLVSGERVRRLPGLATPASSPHLTAEDALTYPAVQLFVERATDRLESFEFRDGDASTVAEICRRLDGLALAIEFAATRIDAFGVGGLLKQLDDRFRLLVGRRAGPERQRTMTATLDWSYGLLSPREASVLRVVSVFAGVFDIDGAAAVSALTASEAAVVLPELVAKSLLAMDIDGDGASYRLLETTRTYCVERLQVGGEDQEVRQRHAEHMLEVLERATTEWAQRPAGEWGSAYGRSIDDLRSALAWAGQDAANRSLRIRLTVAGLLIWNHFSLTGECSAHVSQAVDDLDSAGLSGTAFEMKLKLWLGGSTMFTRGLRPQSMNALRRALQIATQIGDTDYHLRCLMMIGIYELFTGEHDSGLRTLENFTAVASKGDPSILPESDVHTGIAELFLGRLQSARQRLESLAKRDLRYFGSYVVRYLSDPIVLVRSVLTQVQWLTGSADSAMSTAVTGFERARDMNHHLSLNNILSYMCPVFYWSGEYEACERYVTLLDEHVTRHGLVARRPVASFYRAALNLSRGLPHEDTVSALRQAIEDFRSINHLARMPYYLTVLAEALAISGQIDDADSTVREALTVARKQNEGWCLPEVLRMQARMCSLQGDPDAAEVLLLESMARAQDVGALSWRLRSANDLAALWTHQARPDEARKLIHPLYNEFTEGFTTRDLKIAATFLGASVPARPKVSPG